MRLTWGSTLFFKARLFHPHLKRPVLSMDASTSPSSTIKGGLWYGVQSRLVGNQSIGRYTHSALHGVQEGDPEWPLWEWTIQNNHQAVWKINFFHWIQMSQNACLSWCDSLSLGNKRLFFPILLNVLSYDGTQLHETLLSSINKHVQF